MTDIDIYRFDVSGTWDKTTGQRKDKALVDRSRSQAHAIDRHSVFIPTAKPKKVQALDELTGKPAPLPPWDKSRHAIAVEDNAVLPIFPHQFPPPIEMVERTVDLIMAVEENKAPLDAERDDRKADKVLFMYRIFALSFLFVVMGGAGLAVLVWMVNTGLLSGLTSTIGAAGGIVLARPLARLRAVNTGLLSGLTSTIRAAGGIVLTRPLARLRTERTIYERVMVIARPHNFFVLAPRQWLYDTFGAEARFIPRHQHVKYWAAIGAAAVAMGLAAIPLMASYGTASLEAPILASMLGLLTGAYMMGPGFRTLVYPRAYDAQPLWCVLYVQDDYEWEPVYDEVDDGEGHNIRVLVDVPVKRTVLETPEFTAFIPRAMVQEASPMGEAEDKGIQRADFLYLAMNPTDVREWFKLVGGRLGREDLAIGAGYVIAALIVVFLFVQTQAPPQPG